MFVTKPESRRIRCNVASEPRSTCRQDGRAVFVIHDRPDDKARTILQVCRRAMSSTGKLLLVEMLITPGGNPLPKFIDPEMLVIGGRERTKEDFHQLLASAGFRLNRIVPKKSRASIIEGTPV